MKVQQTFKNNWPTIYLVGTPIGNLNDMSNRAIKILNEVDIIACEDTRNTQVLLKKFNIKKKLISLHMHNETERIKEINQALSDGKNIAIVSDAGAPVISDPGAAFINGINQTNTQFNVTAVNVGPAYIHAIVAAGFTNKQNYFHGFIEHKTEQTKKEELISIINKYNNEAIVSFYESVHRIKSTVALLVEILDKEQKILVARELTKINEEFIFGSTLEVAKFVASESFIEKGEFVIVVDQFSNCKTDLTDQELADEVASYLAKGFKLKQASEVVANLYNKKKNEVYKIYLDFYK
ncbi:16S rRNA (cytidine(1402)-2'-O)-methyltransferase [Mesoplasma syrphidae]|uniref:Ribosomal RNA small subunit methyltransferase I n=1 Tax=Mesoplasma syrphidae TaxID=225999 RepID=A0A2K9C9K0_9MOLU|nr:16S rRNA (cytidine(1402)-2'-O)-methyltransferase [Mesoplasma syrphidae]AUF83695.1 16S rRNA (cytidine(1402)-2'-O)-methyltransferase [Mesoplasma syrphidae]